MNLSELLADFEEEEVVEESPKSRLNREQELKDYIYKTTKKDVSGLNVKEAVEAVIEEMLQGRITRGVISFVQYLIHELRDMGHSLNVDLFNRMAEIEPLLVEVKAEG